MTSTTHQAPVKTYGDYEAVCARYNAISGAYRELTRQAHALLEAVGDVLEAVGDEYDEAITELARYQGHRPGITPADLAGEPMTASKLADLELLADRRLRQIFPWASL